MSANETFEGSEKERSRVEEAVETGVGRFQGLASRDPASRLRERPMGVAEIKCVADQQVNNKWDVYSTEEVCT